MGIKQREQICDGDQTPGQNGVHPDRLKPCVIIPIPTADHQHHQSKANRVNGYRIWGE